MDEDDFEFQLKGWSIKMTNGKLEINNVSYEETEDDPIYDLVREIAFLKGVIN